MTVESVSGIEDAGNAPPERLLRLVGEVPVVADPVLVAADAAVREYFAAADASNTVRSYASAWRGFTAWCAATGLVVLPASPRTVARYLAQAAADPDRELSASTIGVWRAAIGHAHTTAGLPDPTTDALVARVVKGIKKDRTTAGDGERRAPAATLPIVQRLVTDIHESTDQRNCGWRMRVAARRDIALVVLLYAAALRRGEAAGLVLGDLCLVEDPDLDQERVLRIRLRGSKTSRTTTSYKYRRRGSGQALWCPWCALLRWLDILTVHDYAVVQARKYCTVNEIRDERVISDSASVAVQSFLHRDTSDPSAHRCIDLTQLPQRHRRAPLLRPLHHGGLPRRAALTEKSVGTIVGQRAEAAGVGPLRGHSFRAGTATHLFDQGATAEQVMALTGHQRVETALLYDRRREQRSATVDTGL